MTPDAKAIDVVLYWSDHRREILQDAVPVLQTLTVPRRFGAGGFHHFTASAYTDDEGRRIYVEDEPEWGT